MSSKKELFKILEKIGDSLDITPSQYNEAKERYEAVGKWLAEGEYCILGSGKKQCFKDGQIYPQGSIRLETAVRPKGKNEFDIDLVFYTQNVSADDITPNQLKKLIGNRLKEHETYKKMLKPLNRGWCLEYANKFHLDITPSLDNHYEPHNESELVADKELKQYMPSNPKGLAQWFDNISEMQPMLDITKSMFESRNTVVALEDAATVTELPDHNPHNKALLKRFVQIFKRHRDEMFKDQDDAPISIIITTLAAKAYEYCIRTYPYDNAYDLMVDTLKHMPKFIEMRGSLYWIENPTVTGENFAEKWNIYPKRKEAFDRWHSQSLRFFSKFNEEMGQHVLFNSLEEGFGSQPAELIRKQYIDSINTDRGLGRVIGATAGVTSSVKTNTFYGDGLEG